MSDGTLLGTLLLAQKFIGQRLICNKVMGAKLHPLADLQVISNNSGKVFYMQTQQNIRENNFHFPNHTVTMYVV